MADSNMDLGHIFQKIKQKRQDLLPLYTKQDLDLDTFRLKPFQLMDYNGKTPVKRCDNVTLNDPWTFATRIFSIINGAELVITLRAMDGKPLSDDLNDSLKEWYFGKLEDADNLLKQRRKGKLRNNLVQIAAMRGVIGVRVLVWVDETTGEVHYDATPFDTRFGAWEYGATGLIWGASETERSKAAVIEEYGDKLVMGIGRMAKVTEYYDSHLHVIFINGSPIKDEPNPLGYPPLYIAPVGAVEALKKPNEYDGAKWDGQSIYDGVRETYFNDNKLASIWMTTSAFGFRPPMQKVTPPGEDIDEMPEGANKLYTGGGQVIDSGHSRLEPLPLKDVAASLPAIVGLLSAGKQRATFPDVEYGEVRYPLSAVAIAKLSEGRNQVFAPILEAITDAVSFTVNQFRKQTIKLGLDNSGIELNKLSKEHRVKIEYFATSPDENISNLSVAAAARGFYDSDTIRTKILKQRNEGTIEKNLDDEWVNQLMPELKAYRVAKRYIEEDRVTEATLIIEKLRQQFGMNIPMPGQKGASPPLAQGAPAPPTPPSQPPVLPPMPAGGVQTGTSLPNVTAPQSPEMGTGGGQ